MVAADLVGDEGPENGSDGVVGRRVDAVEEVRVVGAEKAGVVGGARVGRRVLDAVEPGRTVSVCSLIWSEIVGFNF